MPLGRRLLHARLVCAWAPAALLLCIAVSPAVHVEDAARRVVAERSASIRDVDASLTALSAGVAERLPQPGVWPMQVPAHGVAALALLSSIALVGAAVPVPGPARARRRDRAPPPGLLLHA